MIKIEKAKTYNFDGAIRGMRNPMNSWDKSDSRHCRDFVECKGCLEYVDRLKPCKISKKIANLEAWDGFIIGENDLKLMQKLIKAGSEHRKFLRQIFVSVDITAPLYWWKEFDTYKVGTVGDSCSTMHKIHVKPFTVFDFSCEHLFTADVPSYRIEGEDNEIIDVEMTARDVLGLTIDALNHYRTIYLKETNEKFKKKIWWQMIQLLPSSYNQKRTVTLNYEVLYSMYRQRKNHKLDEWRSFCDWIKELPYSELIV